MAEVGVKIGVGQDSHRFETTKTQKTLMLGGVEFPGTPALKGNSDADVVLHAITNAISGVTGIPILGPVSDEMCQNGITDSREYVSRALQDLKQIGYEVGHISCTIEGKQPKILPMLLPMRGAIASLLNVNISDVAITATTGEGLSDFGRGEGIQVFAILTAKKSTD